MGQYEDLCRIDVIPVIKQMGLEMDWEGKVRVVPRLNLDHVWIESGLCENRKCTLWLNVFFSHFSLLPKQCMGCWKIFYQMDSVRELWRVHKLQQSGDGTELVSKCGIEARPFTGKLGNYMAFWYNPLGCGLEEARENLKKVHKAVGNRNAQLKRGCTEMEIYSKQRFGAPSDRWDELKTPQADLLQELLESTFVLDDAKIGERTPTALRVNIIKRWIHYAMEHGDKTYLDFVDAPLVPSLVLYGNSIHREEDYGPAKSKAEGGASCKQESVICSVA